MPFTFNPGPFVSRACINFYHRDKVGYLEFFLSVSPTRCSSHHDYCDNYYYDHPVGDDDDDDGDDAEDDSHNMS